MKLLEEVSQYLKRLPHVPVTAQMVRKIDAHLESPQTISARRLASEHERAQGARSAVFLDPLGVPLVELEVYADRVTLQITPDHHFRSVAIARLQARDVLELPLVPLRRGRGARFF
ncbi:hypothetical protein [Acidovorax sp. NO-1]|uniref:hypothetical protein n=1 Tax=Acidovorax sp. NO-1 TaxID=512030 RepID=UPI0011126862|nr:hypothetical protein [Acidovorax sp. NO-1]